MQGTTYRYLRATLIAALAAAGLARADGLEPRPLPLAAEIESPSVRVELDGGRVDVLVDDEAPPAISVVDLLKGDASEGFVLFADENRSMRLAQSTGSEEIAPRVAVELVVNSDQKVKIVGEDVNVTVHGTSWQGDRDAGTTRGDGGGSAAVRSRVKAELHESWLDLELEKGSLVMSGIVDVYLTAEGTDIYVEETAGTIDVALQGSSFDLRNHTGAVLLRGVDSDVELSGAGARLHYELDGGSLSLVNGSGSVDGTAIGANILIEAWQGGATIRGRETDTRVVAAGTANEQLLLNGSDHVVEIDGFGGELVATLDGGSLDVRDLGGRATVRGKGGARVTLDSIDDAVELDLSDGSDVSIRQVGKTVRAKVEDGAIDASDVRGLKIRARDSLVRVSGEVGLLQLTMKGGEGTLDLAASPSVHDLSLSGRASVDVELAEPCVVRLVGKTDIDDVSISGCDAVGEAVARQRSRSDTAAGRSRPRGTIKLKVDEEVSVEVFGAP